MARFALILVILALIPFAVYWVRRGLSAQSGDLAQDDVPTQRLITYSLILIVVLMGIFVIFDRGGSSRDGRYVPPRLEGGEVISGHFEEESEPDQDTQTEDPP